MMPQAEAERLGAGFPEVATLLQSFEADFTQP